MSNFSQSLKRAFFSPFLKTKSAGQKIAYLSLFAAISVVTNMYLEYKMADIQFSFTILISIAIGIFAGALPGFAVCFIGDVLGFLINSWGLMYMPWVGLSTATFALISGVVINGIDWKFKGQLYLKIFIVCLLTFLICTIGINSSGFYIFNKKSGFSTAVIDYVEKTFGGSVSFFGYCCYRLIFKGQIFNSIFNYALAFIFIPILLRVKFFKNKASVNDENLCVGKTSDDNDGELSLNSGSCDGNIPLSVEKSMANAEIIDGNNLLLSENDENKNNFDLKLANELSEIYSKLDKVIELLDKRNKN